MIRAARIVRTSVAAASLDGSGAALYGGRWNSIGTPAVYAAESISLAALEVFVHLGTLDTSVAFVCTTFLIAEHLVDRLDRRDLDEAWGTSDGRLTTASIGTTWLRSASNAALLVPSAIVPEEHVLLCNPRHPGFASIQIERTRPFSFDARLWKQHDVA